MRIANLLFNYKKSASDNQILGVERCFIDYTKHLILNGHEVVSVTKPKMVFADEVRKTGSKFFEVAARGQADIFSIFHLLWILCRFSPDVVVCHSGRALFFARTARFFCLKKFPLVAVDHGIKPQKFLSADYVLTVNSYFSGELVKAGMLKDRALVIPNMIELPKDFVLPVKPKFRKPLRVGSLGRLYPEKFFDKMVRALPILQARGIECDYVIGGVGPQEVLLYDLARELGVEKNFKILGWTTDKQTFFDEIDVFILPSWGETFGIVLLEAMLYNTPIVTSNSWGPDEIIADGVDGLKVSKDDQEKMPELIADAVERLAKNEEFARQLAAKAHQKFLQNYQSEMVGKKLSEILTKIAKK
ncbi:MAG: glycosyltransferase family 4 protein [Alphaproteobacteria bacterium]|nr:glycosyltransferase family 4 protein [Alphaproteobacteria bacterium]